MGRKRTVTARPTYKAAVRWIALNDETGANATVEDIADYISTCLVADLFGAAPMAVAIDVVRTRLGAGPFAHASEIAARAP